MGQILREKKTHGIITPVGNYPAEKEKFFKTNPEIEIIEEVKTLTMGVVEVPDPVLIGKTKQQQALMIAWLIVYH